MWCSSGTVGDSLSSCILVVRTISELLDAGDPNFVWIYMQHFV
jgi:hypothetical protein